MSTYLGLLITGFFLMLYSLVDYVRYKKFNQEHKQDYERLTHRLNCLEGRHEYEAKLEYTHWDKGNFIHHDKAIAVLICKHCYKRKD